MLEAVLAVDLAGQIDHPIADLIDGVSGALAELVRVRDSGSGWFRLLVRGPLRFRSGWSVARHLRGSPGFLARASEATTTRAGCREGSGSGSGSDPTPTRAYGGRWSGQRAAVCLDIRLDTTTYPSALLGLTAGASDVLADASFPDVFW